MSIFLYLWKRESQNVLMRHLTTWSFGVLKRYARATAIRRSMCLRIRVWTSPISKSAGSFRPSFQFRSFANATISHSMSFSRPWTIHRKNRRNFQQESPAPRSVGLKWCNDLIYRVVTFLYRIIGNEKATVYFQLIARKYRISNNLLQDTKNFPTGQISGQPLPMSSSGVICSGIW